MKDISQMEREFEEYERKIQRLKELEAELISVNTEGLESEANAIKSKLKDPKKVEEIEKNIATLKVKIKERGSGKRQRLDYSIQHKDLQTKQQDYSKEKNMKNR